MTADVRTQLDRIHQSTERLLTTVADIDEDTLRAPSLLPGWSRAHVLVHIARNADAQVRMTEGALRGELVEQYRGGVAGRAQQIEDDSAADLETIVSSLRNSITALDRLWSTLPESAWDLDTQTLRSRRTVREGAESRWRELEIHHADLGCRYSAADWPSEFVSENLEETVKRLGSRITVDEGEPARRWRLLDLGTQHTWTIGDVEEAPEHTISGTGWQLLAWMFGRGDHGLLVDGSPAGNRPVPGSVPRPVPGPVPLPNLATFA